MYKHFVAVIALLLSTSPSYAGVFGGPSDEEVAQKRLEEKNCISSHSFAYCVLQAGHNLGKYKDVDLPEEMTRDFASDGKWLRLSGGAAGVAVGVSQMTGSLPVPFSRPGLGAISVLGGLLQMTEADNVGMGDKIIAFLPEAEAPDVSAANAIFEKVFIDAMMKAVPGATSVTFETFPLEDDRVASSWVVHGGDCETKKCVIWSRAWSQTCRASNAPCKKLNFSSRLVENGFLGEGKYWIPSQQIWMVLLENPITSKELFMGTPLTAPFSPIAGINDKLELMQRVSANLPPWASYFLGQMPKHGVPYPVLMHAGNRFHLVRPKNGNASEDKL